MTGSLRRLSRPLHRFLLAAAMLALLALGAISLFPPRPPQLNSQSAAPAAVVPRGNLATLLAITTDTRSMIPEAAAAKAANAALPLVANGLQSAGPFPLAGGTDLLGAERALRCLALAMYYEAGFEGPGGRQAVAQVVLNRVRHPAFPHSVCAVVFQRSPGDVCQFTFACDGALDRPRQPELWQQTLVEAAAALGGQVFAPVGMATHYHADYVFPDWAPRLDKIAVLGTHVFYRWPDGWGLRRAFTATYAGSEPDLAWLDLPPTGPEAALPPASVEQTATASEIPPIRSGNEGGFVDPAKGWVPQISLPTGSAATTPATPPIDVP